MGARSMLGGPRSRIVVMVPGECILASWAYWSE